MLSASTRRQKNDRSSSDSNSGPSAVKRNLIDLPLETQKNVFHWSRVKDLLVLQRVSRHFHALASARLYCSMDFVLTHVDAPGYYTKSQTRLAEALHTFATSEHDYGQFIKSFKLQLSSRDAQDVRERVLSKYHFEEETTKLLNTTLLLMIRQAKTMEAFVWDASIELNGHVYLALSKIPTLQQIRIRLDTRAIPRFASTTLNVTAQQHQVAAQTAALQAHQLAAQQAALGFTAQVGLPPGYSHGPSSTSSNVLKKYKANPNINLSGRRKFSNFNNLRRLEIVGIDDLGPSLSEMASCISGCSSTLKILKLTLSQELARRARKPAPPVPVVNPTIETEMDDDDDDMTPSPEIPVVPATVNDADIRKEKVIQESILTIVFGLEPAGQGDRQVDKTLKASAKSFKPKEDLSQVFVRELRKHLQSLINTKVSLFSVPSREKQAAEDLAKALDKYLESGDPKKQKTGPAVAAKMKTNKASSVVADSHASITDLANDAEQTFKDYLQIGSKATPQTFQEYFAAKNPMWSTFIPPAALTAFITQFVHTYTAKTASSSTINEWQTIPDTPSLPLPTELLAHGAFQHKSDEGDSDGEVLKSIEGGSKKTEEPSLLASPEYFPAVASTNIPDQEDSMDVDIEHPDVVESDEDDGDQEMVEEYEDASFDNPTTTSKSEESDACAENTIKSKEPIARREVDVKKMLATKTSEQSMWEYILSKHGYTLDEFSLYLIPIKASTMARALDFTCLKRLTLLNVGPQGGFWSFLTKLQKESTALQLSYIHTDDVSLAFLNCVANLKGLISLFLMKRSSKESDASVSLSNASLGDIRFHALRNHIGTLKQLAILNHEDETWDLDAKTVCLLAAKGVELIELAFNIATDQYHVLMQNLRGFKSLVALHIVILRTPDPCSSIPREFRRFAIDAISYCPGLKLQILAMCGAVYFLVRKPERLKPTGKQKYRVTGKGKEKASEDDLMDLSNDTAADSESFSDAEKGGVEMAVSKHLRFQDVPHVKIFDVAIRTGAL